MVVLFSVTEFVIVSVTVVGSPFTKAVDVLGITTVRVTVTMTGTGRTGLAPMPWNQPQKLLISGLS